MSNDKKDDERPGTVIPWPGTRVATPPAAPAPEPAAPSSDASAQPADPSAAPADGAPSPGAPEPEEFSMDAFETAVRRAVEEKLGPVGDTPRFPPRGADELVAQVFSALSGKDGKTALAEVRERLANESKGAPVIDLAAAREARRKLPPESPGRVAGALKDTFGQFMAQLSASQGNRSEIVLDSGFFREHGASLLGNLFQGLASALMQGAKADNAAATAPPTEPPPAATTEAEPPPRPEGEAAPGPATTPPEPPRAPVEPVQVQVRVDFASILSSLFRRPKPPPTDPTDGGTEPR